MPSPAAWSDEQRQSMYAALLQWQAAVQLQGGRLQEAGGVRLRTYWNADALLFIAALACLRACSRQVLGSDHPAFHAFERQVPDVEGIRNWILHLDEYLLGRGHRQVAYRAEQLEVPWVDVAVVRSGGSAVIVAGDMQLRTTEAMAATEALCEATREALLDAQP